MKTKVSLLFSVFVIASMVLTACGAPAATQPPAATEAPATEGPAATEAPGATEAPAVTTFAEAPALAEMVSAGSLPSVEERLPDEPVVTEVVESIGQYGGTIHTASWWPEVGNVQLFFAVEAPIKWKSDLTGYEPGLAESYEWSEDGMTFTLHLRPGIKWSDGEPYTTADWQFWWEDFAKNADQKLWTIPAYLRNADGTPIDITFPDEYTVVWQSKDRPLWIDPYFMAQGFWEFARWFMKPAHYLSEYHPELSTSGATWEDFANQDKWWQTPGYPCLFAWCLSELSDDGLLYTFSRNPYYWRVDTEGNQLPYIDEIQVEIVADEQTRILNCSQGKYDMAFRICGSPNEIPFLSENAESGGYHFLENYMNGAGAWPGYMVNQDYVEGGNNYENDTPEKAAEIRELLRNSTFRKALSIGFDRARVIDVAWGGIAEPKGVTISPQSWHFTGPEGQEVYQRWSQADVGFDVDAANAMLDEIGMTKGADGFRTLPSGEPFEMVIDVTDWGGSLKVQVDAANEMEQQWETNLGIAVRVNNIQGQPDVDTRTNEGYYMLRGAHISEIDILTYPDWLFPVVNRYMFPLQGRWFAKGGAECTEEPSEGTQYPCGLEPEEGSPAQRLQELYNQARETGTEEGRHQVVWDAIDVVIEEGPFVIGVAGDQPMPIIIKDYMRNVLDFGVVGPWAPATPGNQIAAQWWIEQ
ncbi:MAG TPA: ABC transporter substrate-binding protein [Anaerolineales bacterium]|nr:ABC transporter substrate-binding protein [Anaerolineales bacterium]